MKFGFCRRGIIFGVMGFVLAGFASSLEVNYKASIQGINDHLVKRAIEESLLTFKLEKRPLASVEQLRRRVKKEIPRIEKILESRGYYDGTAAVDMDEGRDPIRVVFKISPGEPYRFNRIELTFFNNDDASLLEIIPRWHKKGRVVATQVFAEEQRVLDLIRQRGYPFPILAKRTVEVDRENHRVDMVLIFDPGVLAVYGAVEAIGLESLSMKYIQRQIPWKSGDKYDLDQLSDFENKLLSTGLFGTARVEPLPPPAGSNSIPIKISLNERALRTIRLGVGYSDIGPSGKMIWEHRNLFGNGERLETAVSYSPIELNWNALLERPGFLRANQSLLFDIDVSRETPDAYDADKLTVSGMVKRDIHQHIMVAAGLRYKYSRVEQFLSLEEYSHIIFPVMLEFDYRNDSLNPVEGGQAFLLSSFYEDMNGSDSFFKTVFEGRLYKMFWKAPRLSGAFRLRLGSINGTAVEHIPSDERFYAGGGGSIRGYEYQSVGPQLGDTPLGGAQLLEFSTELRLQPGRKLGYAIFLDGGSVYNDWTVDANRTLHYGAGVGLRWFTGIGPFRADVAYPLNPADGQVERVQFYISLGQAF